MKHVKDILLLMLAACLLAACASNDDDSDLSDLSAVERSMLGYWLLVEKYSYYKQQPVEGIQVVEFKSDRTQSFYKNGDLQSETQFWVKPTENNEGYYLYHKPDVDYSQMTFSCNIEVDDNQLTIWEYGCFNVQQTVSRRIPKLYGR